MPSPVPGSDSVIRRFVDGNLGDHKGVGAGVIETRINSGLATGFITASMDERWSSCSPAAAKTSQAKDIENAKERWQDYKDRKRGGF